MNVAERDFNNFELGDDVYKLADGLISEIAGRLGFMIGEKPDSGHMHDLVGMLGKNKVLRDNEPATAIDLETAAELLERSGVQKPLDRSLWTPNLQLVDLGANAASGFTVVTGGVANWQDRTTELVAEAVGQGELPQDVRVVTGQRLMGKIASEAANPNVKAFHEKKLRLPTETEYATRFVLPVLDAAGARATLTSYATESGEEIANNFSRNVRTSEDDDEAAYEKLFERDKPVTFARVANAGIQLAIQFRQAIRTNTDPDFDSEAMPDIFIRTDGFPIARTEEQVQDPANYQSPYTGLRQVVLTAKMLHEAVRA